MTNLLTEQSKGVKIGRIHAVGSALPDHNKNYVIDDQRGVAPREEKRRNELTDANRSTIVGGFLHGDSDWLWFLDDDTVPPKGALSHLLGLGREFVGGVYYLAKPPHNPIAYYRTDDGTYAALLNYPVGGLFQVDSIGMGCTLIHRSVFERIQNQHEVFLRPNGSLIPIHKDKIKGGEWDAKAEEYVENGVYHMPLTKRHPDDRRPWPFFALEYGRTEDHHFCELAASVGVRPYLDTTLVCNHFKLRAINRAAHKLSLQQLEAQRG
jgi:hypothetical protein